MQNVENGIRFNAPTADGQNGAIQLDGGPLIPVTVGRAFTLGARTWTAGRAMIFQQAGQKFWTIVGTGIDSRNPARLLAWALRNPTA